MSSRSPLEHVVEGAFRALLICSAIYVGAKYSPYVLKLADKVKEKIIPGSMTSSFYSVPNELREIPDSLQYSDPKLYNAILIDRYVMLNEQYSVNRTPINKQR